MSRMKILIRLLIILTLCTTGTIKAQQNDKPKHDGPYCLMRVYESANEKFRGIYIIYEDMTIIQKDVVADKNAELREVYLKMTMENINILYKKGYRLISTNISGEGDVYVREYVFSKG